MVRNIIDQAIRERRCVEMVYTKKGLEFSKQYQLDNIAYSDLYGRSCICGTIIGYETRLTFRVDRIKSIELIELAWNDIYKKETEVHRSGIFLMACRGDNHLVFELIKYQKGDKFWDLFLGSNAHYDGCFDIFPLAYHYIPPYSSDDRIHWQSMKSAGENLGEEIKIYVLAYTMEDNMVHSCEDEFYLDIPRRWECENSEMNGIHYSVVFGGTNRLKVSKNVKILACHHCKCYTEKDHVHWWSYQEIYKND